MAAGLAGPRRRTSPSLLLLGWHGGAFLFRWAAPPERDGLQRQASPCAAYSQAESKTARSGGSAEVVSTETSWLYSLTIVFTLARPHLTWRTAPRLSEKLPLDD